MSKKLNGRFWLAVTVFSLMGQIAWVVENMYFNVFIYKMFSCSAGDISLMVALSAVTSTVTTVFMERHQDGIPYTHARLISVGDTSHLYAGGEPLSTSGLLTNLIL